MQSILCGWTFLVACFASFEVRAVQLHSKQVLRSSALHVAGDEVSDAQRQQLFEARRLAVEQHNANQQSSWKAAVNHFSNMTDRERRTFLGYNRDSRASGLSASLLQSHSSHVNTADLAEAVDRRKELKSAGYVQHQGDCGSCWAVASVGALEMRLELSGANATLLSWQHLVDCAPNPRHCGGPGGCDGATAEVAFAFAKSTGISAASDYKRTQAEHCSSDVHPAVQVQSFVQLPSNKIAPVLAALNEGPVVVAVSADGWYEYGSGIFDHCQPDAITNHAVLLVGYGRDIMEVDPFSLTLPVRGEQKYWLIRNSWGAHWGEDGYIRLLRHSNDGDHCGIDRDPQQGTACMDGPKEIPVCGMCGILSDVSYPVGTQLTSHGSKLQ